MAAAAPPEAWLPPTAAEAADPSAAAAPASTATISPLERELLHEAKEARGELRFLILRNDGSPLACERLLELKNIFGKQLPKMGKQYIARLVFDRQHESLAAVCSDPNRPAPAPAPSSCPPSSSSCPPSSSSCPPSSSPAPAAAPSAAAPSSSAPLAPSAALPSSPADAGEVVGGITYRPHPSQAFAEVVFCAVSAEQQVRGYGARIMNQLMERLKRQGITHLLTYADNHAIGYFRKQGFNKQVTMKRERWHGYIKDYDGATLMEFIIDPRIDYLSTKRLADQQRNAIMQKIQTMTSTQVPRSGAAVEPGALPLAVPGLEHTSWRPSELHCSLGGEALPLSACLLRVFEAIQSHEDAWPFRKSVSVSDAPDYYQIIKDPLDLSVIKARLARRPPYYTTVDMLRADICRMCDNCRVYNGEGNHYWDCAVRLEQFARARFAEISVAKRVKVASPQRDPAPQS